MPPTLTRSDNRVHYEAFTFGQLVRIVQARGLMFKLISRPELSQEHFVQLLMIHDEERAQKPFQFMRLPPEIRSIVYGYACIHSEEHGKRYLPYLIDVNRETRQLMLPIFCGVKCFVIEGECVAPDLDLSHDLIQSKDLLRVQRLSIPSDAFRLREHIKRFRLLLHYRSERLPNDPRTRLGIRLDVDLRERNNPKVILSITNMSDNIKARMDKTQEKVADELEQSITLRLAQNAEDFVFNERNVRALLGHEQSEAS